MKFIPLSLFLSIWLLALAPRVTVAGTVAVQMSCKKGGAPQAIDLAYRDFYAFLSRSSGGSSSGKLKSFLADINNYEIRAVLERDRYVVKFLPNGYPDGVIKGGGAKYTINKCTFQIEDIQGRLPLE